MTLLVSQSTGSGDYHSSGNMVLEAMNGPWGLALVDCMSSAGARQLGNNRKLHVFSSDRGHGALMGTGFTDICLQVGSQIREMANDIPEEKDFAWTLANKVRVAAAQRVSHDVGAAVLGELNKGLAPYRALLESGDIDEERFEKEKLALVDKLAADPPEKSYNERHPVFMLTLYDKKEERMRHFTMRSHSVWESFDFSIARGSGQEGGERTMDVANAGLTHTLRSRGMLAYEALDAYVISSFQDDGVGNDCFMAEISPQEAYMVETTKVTAMHNLVCAFRSGLNPELTEDKVIGALENILEEKKPKYSELREMIRYPSGNAMGLDEFTLVKMPYYQLRNIANRHLTRKRGVKPAQ